MGSTTVLDVVDSAYGSVIRVLSESRDNLVRVHAELIKQIRSDPIKRLFLQSTVNNLLQSKEADGVVRFQLDSLKAAVAYTQSGKAGFDVSVATSSIDSPAIEIRKNGFTVTGVVGPSSKPVALSFGRDALPPPKKKQGKVYAPDQDAVKDFDDALRKANESDKLVLLEFGANWCGPCHVLHQVLMKDEEIGPLVKRHFVLVRVNVGDFSQNRNLSDRFDLDLMKVGIPYLMAVDSNGKVSDLGNESQGLPTSDIGKLRLALEVAIKQFKPAKILE